MKYTRGRLTRPIDVVEAAYDLHRPTEQWLRRLLRAVAPSLDAGQGVYGFVVEFQEKGWSITSPFVGRGVDPTFLGIISRANARPPREVVEHLRGRVVDFGSAVAAFGGPSGDMARAIRAVAPNVRDSLG